MPPNVTHWRFSLARLLQGLATAAEGKRALAFTLQQQLQTNWCWAACATSASGFYDPATTWGQCTLVNAELGEAGCCDNGASGSCNVPWYLDKALSRTGNFMSKKPAPASWEAIRAEVDAGRPVGARIGWRGGGGHFVFLTGYRKAGALREVEVQDPWTGRSALPLDVFTTNYKSSGEWTHTYLTRR